MTRTTLIARITCLGTGQGAGRSGGRSAAGAAGGGSAELANLEGVDVLLEATALPPFMVHTWTIFTTAGSPELLCFHP
jgi:hypothetical protein